MKLSAEQLDALTEVVNIGVGRAAAALCELVDEHIALRVPSIRVGGASHLTVEGQAESEVLDTSVVQDFSGTINGRALLAFPEKSGAALAAVLGGGTPDADDLEFDLAGVLEEVGNIVLNAVLGSLANLFEGELLYSVPQLATQSPAGEVISRSAKGNLEKPTLLMADAHFEIANSEIRGSLLLAFSMEEVTALLDRLIAGAEAG